MTCPNSRFKDGGRKIFVKLSGLGANQTVLNKSFRFLPSLRYFPIDKIADNFIEFISHVM